MSRYTVTYDDLFGQVEALPKGTPRSEGMTFVEAKKELINWLTKNRDVYAEAVKEARKITRGDVKALKAKPIVRERDEEE